MKVRINMHDCFSHCENTIEKEVNEEQLKKLEQAQINGTVINQFQHDINFYWIIDEVEILN